jgi:hypothetical protein
VRNGPLVVLFTLTALTAGCGASKKVLPQTPLTPAKGFSLQVNALGSANQNNPVAMDLVFVMDKKLAKDVAKMPAKDWFEKRQQLERDHPGKTQVVSWEWVPGQAAGPIDVAVNSKTKAGFLFTNYASTGDHRAAIDTAKPIIVTLLEDDFTVKTAR